MRELDACGGDALFRLESLLAVQGFKVQLIAGEEPELCYRLREKGWIIQRLPEDMTLHDAAITHIRQWCKRASRSGHACAEGNALHPQLWRRETRSALVWGLFLPVAAIASCHFTGGLGLVLLAGYPILWLRVLYARRAYEDPLSDAILYAFFCVLSKFPEVAGMMVFFWWNRSLGRRTQLIEYK